MTVALAVYDNLFNEIILYVISGLLVVLILIIKWIHNYEKMHGEIHFVDEEDKED